MRGRDKRSSFIAWARPCRISRHGRVWAGGASDVARASAARTTKTRLTRTRIMVANYCGIDFGTSNTTVGVSDGATAQLIALESSHRTLPSAMFFDADDHAVHYGRGAIDLYLNGNDGRFMRALKSILGTSL